MSGEISTLHHGYLGCNFCGRISCHNATKPSIIWVLCKSCKAIRDLGGYKVRPHEKPIDSPYGKHPQINFSNPSDEQYRTVNEHWDLLKWDELEPFEETQENVNKFLDGQFSYTHNDFGDHTQRNKLHHFLISKPSEKRELPISVPVNIPTYARACRLAGVKMILNEVPHYSDSSDTDSDY